MVTPAPYSVPTEAEPPELLMRRLYPLPEVRGDYFAVLGGISVPRLVFSPVDTEGGLRFLLGPDGKGPRIVLVNITQVNPHIRDLAEALFGLKLKINTTDSTVLGHDPERVLGMHYRGALLSGRRMQLAKGVRCRPGRLYPVPKINAYVVYVGSPRGFLFCPMRDDGGLPIGSGGELALQSAALTGSARELLQDLFVFPRGIDA